MGTSSSYTITVNPTPTVAVPAHVVKCSDEMVPSAYFNTIPIGGSVSWTNSNTSIGLAASGTGNIAGFISTNSTTDSILGTITVTPILNGCLGLPSSYTITVNPNPIVTPSSNPPAICESGASALSATSTVPGTSYKWMPVDLIGAMVNVTPVSTTTYTVTGNALGCTGTSAITIYVNSVPHPQIIGNTIVCQNFYWVKYTVNPLTSDSLLWTIAGGEFWQNGIWSSDSIGGYGKNEVYVHWFDPSNSLMVKQKTDFGCMGSNSISVNFEGEAPNIVTIIPKNNDINENILICPNGYSHYYWGYEAKDNLIEIDKCSGANWCHYDAINTVNYYYWVKIDSNNSGCLTKSYYNQPVLMNIENNKTDFSVNIYPNPFENYINVEISCIFAENFTISIYSVLGELIFSETNIENKSIRVDLSKVNKGLFVIVISNHENHDIIKKIIKL